MDRYQASDSANGPWYEFVVTNSPQQALDTARAKMDWSIVWVAKMRPLHGVDVLPFAEVFWGEIMERLTVQHGSSVSSQFAEDADLPELYKKACDAITAHLLDVETDIMVPDIKKPYGRDQNVRLADFNPALRKPKLEGLVS